VFGAVAIQGAYAYLLKGLENAAHDENAFTDACQRGNAMAQAGLRNIGVTGVGVYEAFQM
jgi:hypothetical protein